VPGGSSVENNRIKGLQKVSFESKLQFYIFSTLPIQSIKNNGQNYSFKRLNTDE